MQQQRVVITGLGGICGLGSSVAEIWENTIRGCSAIRPFNQDDFPAPLRFANGARIPAYDATRYFEDKQQLAQLDQFAQFGLIAAAEAIGDAALEWTPELQQQAGVITGTSIGGEQTHDQVFQSLYAEGGNRVHPMTIPLVMPNALTSQISLTYGIKGPGYTVSTACASGNHAIGNAFWLVRNGLCDVMITGGSETPFHYGFLKSWEAIRVVASDTCRPFSKNRKGMILGEGAAILVLESLEHARQRGARIYAELLGFGMSADASHITRPDSAGAELAMRWALKDAQLEPRMIQYINAHGTGTPANDSMETTAIKATFGDHARQLAVSSTKSLHGHLLGGVSAVEAVLTTLALHHQMVPPTANYEEFDPECDLDIVPNEARPQLLECALSNAFAFGGLNAVLAFKKWNGFD